jgi:hypothetical protein
MLIIVQRNVSTSGVTYLKYKTKNKAQLFLPHTRAEAYPKFWVGFNANPNRPNIWARPLERHHLI